MAKRRSKTKKPKYRAPTIAEYRKAISASTPEERKIQYREFQKRRSQELKSRAIKKLYKKQIVREKVKQKIKQLTEGVRKFGRKKLLARRILKRGQRATVTIKQPEVAEYKPIYMKEKLEGANKRLYFK